MIAKSPKKVYVYNKEGNYMTGKTVVTDTWYELGSCQEYDCDIDQIPVLTLEDLYHLWQLQKADDRAVGEAGRWKYHFYHHSLSREGDKLVDYVTQGKVYRRGNKIYFKPIEE